MRAAGRKLGAVVAEGRQVQVHVFPAIFLTKTQPCLVEASLLPTANHSVINY